MPDKVNILLVDDQQSKLLSHEVVLEEIGENLLKANSAQEAFEILLKNEVGLILIDVCMPDLDGFELASMIREHPRFQRTSIIFVSAVMNENLDQLRGYQLGAVDFVPVPVIPELLRAKVKVFVDLYRKTRRLERFNAELEDRVSARTSELRLLNEKLEQRIEEKTREREDAMAQLFEAQKMDTIGRLTGGVAHDFNNLLMVILASLSLLEKQLPDEPRSRSLLENAKQGARRGAALTQRLLAFARRQDLKPEPVKVGELLDGMKELFERALGMDIKLVCNVPSTLPPVLADANQLELALLNVALNSRDALPDGGVLTITAAEAEHTADRRLKTGNYVRISLVDNGSGMDETTLSRATEPFFTTKPPGKGTGLGLSMIQGLAAQSGGLLRIQSTQGVGTTIELLMPRAEVVLQGVEQPAETPEPADQAALNSILVVDDDQLVLAGTAGLIEDLGHKTFTAQSGDEALSLLATGIAVDAVITDYMMPTMNGLDLARAIRGKYPDIPVILMTGYAEIALEQDWQWLGKLRKPCTQNAINSAIHAAVSVRGAGA